MGEDHDPETHLIPIVLEVALGQRPHITIFGDDYPTPDGTCIRDYVHVDDLGAAHALALERLEPGRGLKLNLGTGRGHSVKEVIDACRRVTGHAIPAVLGPRREGDPPELVADAGLARATLGWTPEYTDIESIVRTAWRWHAVAPARIWRVSGRKPFSNSILARRFAGTMMNAAASFQTAAGTLCPCRSFLCRRWCTARKPMSSC